jgi:hypothetical protein
MTDLAPDDLIGSREACDILGFTDTSTISRYVALRKLRPIRRMPGATGAFIFNRADVERLRDERAAAAAASIA